MVQCRSVFTSTFMASAPIMTTSFRSTFRRWPAALLAGIALTMSGCVESISYTELPPLKNDRRLLSKDEQATAMAELRRKAEQQSADALRLIEKGPQAK